MGATLFKGSYDKGEQQLSLTLSDFFKLDIEDI